MKSEKSFGSRDRSFTLHSSKLQKMPRSGLFEMSDNIAARVYVLQHIHALDDGAEDVKLVGVYSSRVAAEDAVTRACLLDGFSASPESFSIDEYVIDEDTWPEGYATLNS